MPFENTNTLFSKSSYELFRFDTDQSFLCNPMETRIRRKMRQKGGETRKETLTFKSDRGEDDQMKIHTIDAPITKLLRHRKKNSQFQFQFCFLKSRWWCLYILILFDLFARFYICMKAREIMRAKGKRQKARPGPRQKVRHSSSCSVGQRNAIVSKESAKNRGETFF